MQQRPEWSLSGINFGLVDVVIAEGTSTMRSGLRLLTAHLVMMLKARTTAPRAMTASFRPLFGIYLVIISTLSSLKKVNAGVSQKVGPVILSVGGIDWL